MMRILVLAGALALATGLAVAQPNGLVILLTDYGADSIYVGELKGAIYGKFPEAKVDSISHSIPPFDIVAGAYMLAESCPIFPKGTVFCCIVDPGVGTARKAIALETKAGQFFVGPDNGLLSLVAARDGLAQIREAGNTALWREGVTSTTFHGRDIFGPVAASLAKGVAMKEVGAELTDLVRLDLPPSRVEDRHVTGTVIRADVYGNLVTNIGAANLGTLGIKRGDTLKVKIGGTSYTAPLVSTYADVPEGRRLFVLQSSGMLECAINKGSLAEALGAGLHASVVIERAP